MTRRFPWLFVFTALLCHPMVAQDEEQSARKLIGDQRFAEARVLYEQLLKRDPENLDYQMEIARISAWMKDYAAKNGIVYVDYYSSMVNDEGGLKAELSPDGVHPNKAGYALMAPLAEGGIAEALKKPRP